MVEAGGERHAVPSWPNRTGTGPTGWIPGGRAGVRTGAPGPGSLVVVGRRGGDRAGPWVAAGERGRGRAGRARGRTPRGPRGLGEGTRGRPFLEGGGGCSLPGGRRGPLLSEGGGRACITRCRSLSIHGCTAWDYIPNPPRRSLLFGGGLRGKGEGWRLLCAPTHARGGSPVGAPSGLADKTWWRPLGSWAPARKNLGFAGGDSTIWFGMVWYGMVWYGMVWYGMVWYGMVWYGMVWYGMVWYGMVWYGMVWYGMLLLLLLLGHPARAGGRNCLTRSPWAGRKGAVGRRHAGPACADHDRGGGGFRFLSVRGGGARRCERDHLSV